MHLFQEGLKILQIVSTMELEGRRTSRATVSKINRYPD